MVVRANRYGMGEASRAIESWYRFSPKWRTQSRKASEEKRPRFLQVHLKESSTYCWVIQSHPSEELHPIPATLYQLLEDRKHRLGTSVVRMDVRAKSPLIDDAPSTRKSWQWAQSVQVCKLIVYHYKFVCFNEKGIPHIFIWKINKCDFSLKQELPRQVL